MSSHREVFEMLQVSRQGFLSDLQEYLGYYRAIAYALVERSKALRENFAYLRDKRNPVELEEEGEEVKEGSK